MLYCYTHLVEPLLSFKTQITVVSTTLNCIQYVAVYVIPALDTLIIYCFYISRFYWVKIRQNIRLSRTSANNITLFEYMLRHV
jgi:hypothetical protein